MSKYEHPLSWSAIFRVITAILAVYFIWYLQGTIIMILFSFMLAVALYPIVRRLNKYLPLTLSSVLVVSLLFLPFLTLAATIIPNLIQQFPDILRAVNDVVNNSKILPESIKSIDITQYTQSIGSYLLQSTSTITNVITTFLTIIFLTLYFLIDSPRLKQIALDIIPDDEEKKLLTLSHRLFAINGLYVRGNLFISMVCGVSLFLGMTLLHVPYAAPLALLAAILDLLPLIGAFLGAVPAVIIGFSVSPTTGFLVLGLFLLYQQVENNIVSPSVYRKALDLSPTLSFIAVLIGAATFGMAGAFLALPIAASLPTVAKYWRERKERVKV